MARKQPSENLRKLMKTAGSTDERTALQAQSEFAKALTLPLQQGVLDGDIISPFGIFEVMQLDPGAPREWPLDFLSPGTENEYVAYVIPNHGYIPQRHVEGDYIQLPAFDIGNSIDTNLKYLRHAMWNVPARMSEVLEAGFTKKANDDGWHTLLAASVERNIVVRDSDKAASGQFTKRLVSLGKQVMRRNGGGNSTSLNRGRLTDIYMSPEAMENIRNWNVDQVDDFTRRQIFLADGDKALSNIFGVNLHDLDELGEGQEYQLYLESELNVTLPGGDVEVAVGLDQSKSDSFISMIGPEGLEIFPDPVLHRQRRWGWYGWIQDVGWAVTDSRRLVLLSI